MKFNLYSLMVTRLIVLLKLDHTAVSFTLFIQAMLMSIGLAAVGIPTGIASLAIFPGNLVWIGLFLGYGTFKFMQCLGRTHPVLRVLCSISGLWIWTYTALSFLVVDTVPVNPVEFLLFLPLLCELGYLSSLIYLVKISSKGRRPNDY